MDNQAAVDRSILFPILLGGLSVIGIVVVLLIGRSLNAPGQVPMTPSATRFQYLYLGTEPVNPATPLVEESETPLTDEPVEEEPEIATPDFLSSPTFALSTPIILNTPTGGAQATNSPVPTPSSASVAPLNPGTYDNIYPSLIYSGSWANQAGVAGAYRSTLHVSQQPGGTISFRFIGNQMRFFYQGGSTLGRLNITIDNETETLDQSSGSEWASDVLTNGTHSVSITHLSGGAVNLDYVIIPEVGNTATPTATATITPTLTSSLP